jgi:hypothetical protein
MARWLYGGAIFFAAISAGWAISTIFIRQVGFSGLPLWPIILVIICNTIAEVSPSLEVPYKMPPVSQLKRRLAAIWMAADVVILLAWMHYSIGRLPAMGGYHGSAETWLQALICVQFLPICILTTRRKSYSYAVLSKNRAPIKEL